MSGGTYNYLFNDADAGLYNLNSQRTAVFRWRDQDGNGNYTPGEVNLSLNGPDFISISSAANRRFNSDLVQPMTSELTASFERELVANLGVRVGYVFRHRKDYYSNRTAELLWGNVAHAVEHRDGFALRRRQGRECRCTGVHVLFAADLITQTVARQRWQDSLDDVFNRDRQGPCENVVVQ